MSLTQQQAAREIEARAEAVNSLLGFTKYTFPEWVTGKHHEIICERLEAVEAGETRRLIITAPPRHTKSELSSRRLPAWYMGRNPNKQIICTTYGDDLASDFGKDVRAIVESPEYGNVFDTRLQRDSRAAGKWRTNKGGIYVATGIGGPITGRGADLAIIDDYVKNRSDADSEAEREKTWKWYKTTLYTRLQPKGAIIILATRWHEDDLIGRCLQQDHENWELIELKAINDEGEALWPEWYPLDALEQIKETMGPRDWEALYQQDPQPETGTYFERDWFKRYEKQPEKMSIYISTDFGVTGDGGDYTEFGVWGVDADNDLYALDWYSAQATADTWIDALLDLVAKWGPYTVYGESGVIRRSVEPFLKNRSDERSIFAHYKWITRTADKQAMAQSFRARLSMGKVFFPNTSWAERVISQCLKFPAGKHDDAVDACALIGLALGETFAPQLTAVKPEMKRDRWDKAFEKVDGYEEGSWITA